ncbi:MAG: rod shape-determining protein MreD [Spirochaetia bacterium]|jgi:rod shape-determining protein MreD|nr:rod shape-determining protein MreD [Spirochaetia bacterium]
MRLAASIVLTVAFVLFQTTFLHAVAFQGVIPDLSLIAVVFIANRNGTVAGQTVGFAGGLVEDFLSLSPLGFHALLKTLVGFLAGMSFGIIFIGSFFMPMLMVGAASVLKNVLAALVMALTSDPAAGSFFSLQTLIETGYNMVLSPFVFAILGFIKIIVPKVRE